MNQFCKDFSKGHPLSNCILYYLNWYYKSDNMWEDIRKCIIADGYVGEYMTKWDMVRLAIGIVDDWNEYAASKGIRLFSISKAFVPEWRAESYKKYDSEDYMLLAIFWELISVFAFDYNRTEVPLKKPYFSKNSLLKHRSYKNGVTYKSANKKVDKFNWA